MDSPYSPKQVEYLKAKEDFDYFATNALANLADVQKRNPRAVQLELYSSFLVKRTSSETVQAWFGKRPTGRPLIGNPGFDNEIGAQLVYSFGPTGRVAVFLYPAHSTRAQASEEFILLGQWDPNDLAIQAENHLRALVAYTHVTSLDGAPTGQEKRLIWWLRLVCVTEKVGNQETQLGVIGKKLAELGMRSFFTGLMRILILMAAIALFGWLGYASFGNFLFRRI